MHLATALVRISRGNVGFFRETFHRDVRAGNITSRHCDRSDNCEEVFWNSSSSMMVLRCKRKRFHTNTCPFQSKTVGSHSKHFFSRVYIPLRITTSVTMLSDNYFQHNIHVRETLWRVSCDSCTFKWKRVFIEERNETRVITFAPPSETSGFAIDCYK